MGAWRGEVYDRVSNPQLQWGAEVVARMPIEPATVFLDAGCGSGRVTEVLLERQPDATVVALDASASMLAEAERRLGRFEDRVQLLEADLAIDLPSLGVGPFDAVLSTGAFHWVLDHAKLYRDLAGVLRPGGALVTQAGGEGSIAAVRGILNEIGVEWARFNCYAGDVETRRWLADAGFDGWAWLTPELVEFTSREGLIEYLFGGALSPYIADRPADEQRAICETVAERLPEPTLEFVRINVLARRRP